LLNSKELLEKTGISRATLNNYISWGIVPRPQVLPPGPHDGAAPRIGYFPDDIAKRIGDIQRLKKEGWDMKRIAQHFGSAPPAAGPGPMLSARAHDSAAPAAAAMPASAAPSTGAGSDRESAHNAVGQTRPVLTPVAVLVSDLQDCGKVWAELPAEDYFDLINGIWSMADPIFKRHHGITGKHAGDGFVCHFLPQPGSSYLWNVVAAAVEIKDAMRRVSKEWQLRKGWAIELYVNTGINEGQEWLGRLKAASAPEFTALGKTITQAARISEFAQRGAIWATKNLVAKLTSAERRRLKFGVRRKNHDGHEAFVSSVFAKLDGLAEAAGADADKFKDIGRLPITEIVHIAAHANGH
jgi:class 3 adenylate cyclase